MNNKMTHERAMELLNSVVEYVSIANNAAEQIEELTSMGFTTDELMTDFCYSKEDIDRYLSDDDNE